MSVGDTFRAVITGQDYNLFVYLWIHIILLLLNRENSVEFI